MIRDLPAQTEPRLATTTAIVASFLALGLGCAPDTPPPARTAISTLDDRGEVVGLPAPPERIVSLVPSQTETLIALGAADRLVARTRYDRDPLLADLPSLGGGIAPNIESIAGLDPDLVVTWSDQGDRSVTPRLEALGIPVYAAVIQSLDDVLRHARNLGILLGEPERGDSLANAIEAGLARVRERIAGASTPTVFYIVWNDPPQTAGEGTFLDTVIELAGGENLFADAPSLWPTVALEEVVRRDPDYIVLPARHDGEPADTSFLRFRPGWRALTAVRENRVVLVEADLFNRPGPKVVEAAEILSRALHPERWGDGAPR